MKIQIDKNTGLTSLKEIEGKIFKVKNSRLVPFLRSIILYYTIEIDGEEREISEGYVSNVWRD